MGSGYGGHVQGFVPWDAGLPSQIETHGEVHRIKEIFDDSGSLIILSRMGCPTRLKSKKVEIGKEKMSQMIVEEKLSERTVVKERRLVQVFPQERRKTPIGT